MAGHGRITSCILVYLVEKLPVGSRFVRSRSAWPLHITIVPWFYLPVENEQACLQALTQVVSTMPAFVVGVGAEATFTSPKGGDIPVNLIADQAPMHALQGHVLPIARKYASGFHVEPPLYIESAYQAHITHHDSGSGVHRRHAGDRETIAAVALVSLVPDSTPQQCEVVQLFNLGSHYETAA